jgi:hypothetical protein
VIGGSDLIVSAVIAGASGGLGFLASNYRTARRLDSLARAVSDQSKGGRSLSRRLDTAMQLLLMVARQSTIPPQQIDDLFRVMTEGLTNEYPKYRPSSEVE